MDEATQILLNGSSSGIISGRLKTSPRIPFRERRKAIRRRWYLKHQEREKLKAQEYRKQNPEKVKAAIKAYDLKRHYGITVEERDELFRQNDGKCFICNERTTEHVDHDHVSGKVRGALCHWCNLGLGYYFDNPKLLRAAADYLEGT